VPKSRVAHLAVIGFTLLGLSALGQATIEIPLGEAPDIDGEFTAVEWTGAARVDFSTNHGETVTAVHLLQAAGELYVAFEFFENPTGELIVPEILIDPDNAKSAGWEADDWWFHVSAQNCDDQGTYGNYSRCGLVRPQWSARPNYAPEPHSIPLPAIEVRIPLPMIEVESGSTFGLALAARSWPSDTAGGWPSGASADNPATWGEATLEVNTGVIAFDSARTGNVEIFTMRADGSGSVQVTRRPGEDVAAVWTPDGERITFSSRTGAYTVRPDGIDLRELGSTLRSMSQMNWSPDGRRIVFVSSDIGADTEIFVIDVDSGESNQLTDNDCGDFEPVWLPTGDRIGWSSDPYGQADIFTMHADGGNVIRLTDSPGHDSYPCWSPDGSRIVFCSDRTGAWEIYVMDADGSDVEQLTNAGSFAGSPRWSPNGAQIVFEARWDDDDAEIYVMNADGSGVRQLTDNEADDRRPSWRP